MAAGRYERTGDPLVPARAARIRCDGGGRYAPKSGLVMLTSSFVDPDPDILNCGEGVAGDISRWSPGVNVGKSMDFVDNCDLIKHSQGWLRGTPA